MSSSGDRTAYLRYSASAPKTCICFPKTIGIDPAHNVVCLDPACSTLTADISGQTVIADISGQTVVADISGQTVVADISGQTVVADISGQTVVTDISGQTVVADISGQTVVVDISGQTIGIDPSNNTISLDLSTGLGDAFSRLRVSNPYTLMEFNSILDPNPLYIDTLVSGGASVAHSLKSYMSMIVPATIGARVIRQTHEYVLYQPGKSKLVLMTGVLYTDPSANDIIARIGSFDEEMGVFIQKDISGMRVVLRKGFSDTSDENNNVLQANWNVNTLPGVDFSKAQIFLFDFEWLGVGVVRCGLVINGEIVYYHVFNRNNPLQEPYIPMAKLPLRYEITSDGSANEMRMMCGTVISEGGITLLGKEFTRGIFTDATHISIRATDGYVPIMALRLRDDLTRSKRATIKIKAIDLFQTDANKYGSYQLLLNPTDISGTWVNVDVANGSVAEVAFNNTTRTALTINANTGFPLYTNYFTTRTNSVIETTQDAIVSAYPITTDISGISDTVVLVANHIKVGGISGDSIDVFAFMRWIELI